MRKAAAISVLIADDHPIVIAGLRSVLERAGSGIRVKGEAHDGNAALELAAASPADVYVIDISMPALNGLETMARLLRRDPGAKVVILSMHDDKATVQKALAAGARGYLVKESAVGEIDSALRAVCGGQIYLSRSLPWAAGVLAAGPRALKRGGPALTTREREIVQLIAEGCVDRQIAAKLRISPETVHVHRRNIAVKLDIRRQADLIRYAIKHKISRP